MAAHHTVVMRLSMLSSCYAMSVVVVPLLQLTTGAVDGVLLKYILWSEVSLLKLL